MRVTVIIAAVYYCLGIVEGASRSHLRASESVRYEDTSASADIHGKWRAEQIRLEDSLKPPLIGSPITISFDEAAFSGSAGCNRIFGRSSIETKLDDNDQIVHLVDISGLASTRMLCYPPPIMKQERNFMKSMGHKAFSYKITSDDRLKFYEIGGDLDGKVVEGKLVAVFKRIREGNF